MIATQEERYWSNLRSEDDSQGPYYLSIRGHAYPGRAISPRSNQQSFHCSAEVFLPVARKVIFGSRLCKRWRAFPPSPTRAAIWYQQSSFLYRRTSVRTWMPSRIQGHLPRSQTWEHPAWLYRSYCALRFRSLQIRYERWGPNKQ